MAEQGWIADYVDPEDFLDIKLHSQSTDNYGRYNNPEVDRMLEQARTERDTERRMNLYRQAEQLVVNDAAWIPLYHGRDNLLIKPYVKDYAVTPLVIPNLRHVRIER
jgi:oligopeptide transport system substrate-binding protein